jgi:hypothetical protein
LIDHIEQKVLAVMFVHTEGEAFATILADLFGVSSKLFERIAVFAPIVSLRHQGGWFELNHLTNELADCSLALCLGE